MIFLGFASLGGGMYLATAANELGGGSDEEIILVVGIVLAVLAVGMILINLVPFFL